MGECHAAVIIDDHISCAEIDQWEGGGGKKKKVFIQKNTAEKLSCF